MILTFEELTRYTQEERDKWRAWFALHPDAMEIDVQPGGRYATVGALIDHIFLVERRHLQRLRGVTPDTQTGLSGRHAPPLFDYGASVRRELDQFVAELDEVRVGHPVVGLPHPLVAGTDALRQYHLTIHRDRGRRSGRLG